MNRNEAIDVVKKNYPHINESGSQFETALITLISELKESEDDRIKKALINGVECCKASGWTNFGNNVDIGVVLDWLEKQGKKVEPIEGFNSEFERQISHLIASIINKEHEYTEAFVKWTSDTFLNYAEREIEKQGEKSVNKLKVSGELYEHIRDTCAYIEDAISSETLADINDYLLMAERSADKAFDIIEQKDEQKPAWSEEDNLYYDDICEILVNLLYSKSSNVNKSAIQKDLDWFVTFVKQTRK